MQSYDDAAMDIGNAVYRAIRKEFASSDPVIDRILGEALICRGKGVRPRFMERMAQLNGGSWDDVAHAAMVIEAIHLASLFHDDVVDGSRLRRGTATLNARYTDRISVLFGDYIFMRALAITETLGDDEAVTVIHDAVQRMVEGEIRESICPGAVDEASYLTVIGNKTASLFAAAGEIAIILTGGGKRERLWSRELGECVGVAFQIIDDTLDFHGNPEETGKQRFMDLRSGCLTLPLIHSLRGYDTEAVDRVIAGAENSAEPVLALVREKGGIEYARDRALEYLRRCREILRFFPRGDADPDWNVFFDSMLDRQS